MGQREQGGVVNEYGKLNGVPIDADPSMPAGQKRWEIVPSGESDSLEMEFTEDGVKWHRNPSSVNRSVDDYEYILAFRRPTALKEAGAGSLDKTAQAMLLEVLGSPHNENPIAPEQFFVLAKWHLVQLTQLRTLAKDQGEALEKAEKAFNTILSDFKKRGECRSNFSDGEYTQDYTTRYELINNTLTLIAKLKGEVGE